MEIQEQLLQKWQSLLHERDQLLDQEPEVQVLDYQPIDLVAVTS